MGPRLATATFPHRWSLRLRAALTALAVGLMPACTGFIGDAPDGAAIEGPASGIEVAEVSRFPRLSHEQWENTARDLLKLPDKPGLSASFTSDPLGGKTFDNNE